jgi:hypothetical protein
MQALQDPTTRASFSANARRAVLPLSPPAITLQQVLLYRDLLATPEPGKTGAAAVAPGAGERRGVAPEGGGNAVPIGGGDAGSAATTYPLLDTPAESWPSMTPSPAAGRDPATAEPHDPPLDRPRN